MRHKMPRIQPRPSHLESPYNVLVSRKRLVSTVRLADLKLEDEKGNIMKGFKDFKAFRRSILSRKLPESGNFKKVSEFSNEELHEAIFLAEGTIRETESRVDRAFLIHLYKERKKRIGSN